MRTIFLRKLRNKRRKKGRDRKGRKRTKTSCARHPEEHV
jgi:hypothetical protein